MPVSDLTSTRDQLLQAVLTDFPGQTFSPLTQSHAQFYAQVLNSLVGGNAYSASNTTEARLLALIATEDSGGTLSELLLSETDLLAEIVNAEGEGGGGEGYAADAVHFDGETWLVRDGILSGIADSAHGILSLWSKTVVPDTSPCQFSYVAFGETPADFSQLFFWEEQLSENASSMAMAVADTSENNAELSLFPTVDDATIENWHHVLWAWKTDEDSGEKLSALYINDVLQEGAPNDGGASFSVDWTCDRSPDTGGVVSVGAYVRNGVAVQQVTGDMADFYFNAGTLFVEEDGTVLEATRRKFISGEGKPVDPTNFPAGANILLSGDAAAFVTNQGSGGAFTLVGSLTNADTSPSDA